MRVRFEFVRMRFEFVRIEFKDIIIVFLHKMTKFLALFALFLFFLPTHAGKNPNITAQFLFNNGNLLDEVGKLPIKIYGVSFAKDRFGNSNSACYLQGDFGSYINLGSGSNLKPKIGSISIWVKLVHPMFQGKGVESNPILIAKSRDSVDHCEAYYIGYDLNSKNINVSISVSRENVVTLYSDGIISKMDWQHIVMTYDNNKLCFYLNGKLENEIKKNFESTFLQGDSVIVGNVFSKKNARFFNGCVDDIQIYNTVLTLHEVKELFNAPNPNRSKIILKWIIIALVIIILLLIVMYLVKRRLKFLVKKEKEKSNLQNKALEFEIRMLKAQMDPHFIFNSLNTILQFIIIKDNEKAEIYLTKFSKLIRKILESNTYEAIALGDEIDILEKYLEIESLRFNTVFNHTIVFSESISLIDTFIPHMLIQPFVENAIWHGLRTKKGDKKLIVSFELVNEKILLCIIEDNGVGRSINSNKNEKDKSLALNFIKQRLDLMSKTLPGTYKFTIIDKTDNLGKSMGTKIELTIPIIKN